MSRIFMDGFESGDLSSLSLNSGVTINNSLSGRTGQYCVDAIGDQDYFNISVPSDNEYYIAYKYYPTSSDKRGYISFYEGNSLHCTLLSYSTLPLYIRNGDETVLITSSTILSINTWYLIEVYIKIANSGGRFVVKINGITAIDFTGDTQNGGTGVIDSIRFGMIYFYYNFWYSYAYYDDIIIDNANWIGPSSIQSLTVTGAGNSAQFDPSTGSNYACVDEIPPSDADYISTNVVNEIDTYACGNLTGTINSVKAVQVQARCMQEGSPAVPKIQLVTRPTSTDRVSASKSVQTFAPGMVSNIWELNPDDSAAWESADVNGMEIGVKAVAS